MKKISLILIVFAGLLFGVSQAEASKPKTENVKFWVSMTCLSCQQKIQDNLPFEKGVKDLKVDLAAKTVEVTFDTKKTSTEKIRTSIEKLGYEVKVLQPGEEVPPAGANSGKVDAGHKCAGQKDADHKCTGAKTTEHKCAGEKTTEHKCAGQKDAAHKCTGEKGADHKCCSASNDPNHKCCKGESGEHKCTGTKSEGTSTETKTHNCNHGKQ